MNYTVDYLRKWHSSIRSKNPSFSLRAFANKLGVSIGRLSEYFSGSRQITAAAIEQIIENINDNTIAAELRECVAKDIKARNGELFRENILADSTFEQIKNWHNFSILALIGTDDFRPDPQWIAHRLHLDISIVYDSLQNLKKLGIISDDQGTYKISSDCLVAATTTPSLSMREHHRQMFMQVAERIGNLPKGMSDVNSITLSVRPDKIPKAKEKIQAFLIEMGELLDIAPRTEVYGLCIGLVPLSRIDECNDTLKKSHSIKDTVRS